MVDRRKAADQEQAAISSIGSCLRAHLFSNGTASERTLSPLYVLNRKTSAKHDIQGVSPRSQLRSSLRRHCAEMAYVMRSTASAQRLHLQYGGPKIRKIFAFISARQGSKHSQRSFDRSTRVLQEPIALSVHGADISRGEILIEPLRRRVWVRKAHVAIRPHEIECVLHDSSFTAGGLPWK